MEWVGAVVVVAVPFFDKKFFKKTRERQIRGNVEQFRHEAFDLVNA